MRKLIAGGLVVALFTTVATVALAKSEATTFSLTQSARAEGASTSIKFKITFGDPASPTGVPSGLRSFKIKLHKGTKIDPRGAVQCKVTSEVLMRDGVDACPAASRIGTGTASATSAAGATVAPDAVIFNEKINGRDAFLFVFVVGDAVVTAFDSFVKGNTISSEGLTGALPGDFVVTQFNGTIEKRSKGRGKRKHTLITAPAVCPKRAKKWTNAGTFVFQNGDTDKGTSTSPCKPGK